jgi:hypothetical protein
LATGGRGLIFTPSLRVRDKLLAFEGVKMNLKSRRVWLVVAVACFTACAHGARAQALSQNAAAHASPDDVLKSARTFFIRTRSVYFKPSTLENSLLQQDEFRQWGLTVTRDEADADLIIEVGRKVFTTSFVYSVIDPKTQRVVASGRVNSLGGTVEGKTSHSLLKKLRAARQH